MKIINNKNYKISQWSGGKTKEIYIYPENSSLEDRNFVFRLSSATFNTTSSKFSDFSSYKRYLLALEGHIEISHNNGEYIRLEPFQVNSFLGSDESFSKNSLDCRDFNFIVKEDRDSALIVLEEGEYNINPGYMTIIYSYKGSKIAIDKDEIELSGDSCLLIEDEDKKSIIRFIDGDKLIIGSIEI